MASLAAGLLAGEPQEVAAGQVTRALYTIGQTAFLFLFFLFFMSVLAVLHCPLVEREEHFVRKVFTWCSKNVTVAILTPWLLWASHMTSTSPLLWSEWAFLF